MSTSASPRVSQAIRGRLTPMTSETPRSPARSWLLPGLALATAALHLLFAHRYGYFRNELYFIICGQRLDWGYVDQPPFIALAARVGTALFDHSLTGLRVLPALASAGLVALTGHLARRFGGGGFAVALAALPAALAPIFLFQGHTLTMNAFEPLFWTACAALLVHLIRTGQTRVWLALGALAGVGMLNKYSMAFFTVCLVLGLLLTPERRLLASRWLVLGVLLATALVLPNMLWQHQHGWPMLELLRNGQLYKNTPFQLGEFVRGQFLLLKSGRSAVRICPSLPALFPIHHAALHNKLHFLQRTDVLQRISGNRDHIGPVARFQGADLPFPAEQFCAID